MQALVALTQKELRSLFSSPTAYVVGALFSVFNGYVFWILLQLLSTPTGQSSVEMSTLFFGGTFFFWLALLFMVPVITMRLISEEKKSGTIELLLTAPITDFQIILAKFLGVFVFYTFLWLPSFLYVGVLFTQTAMDWGIWIVSVLGVLLLGAMVLSLGLLSSSLVRNQIIAAVLTFICLMVFFLGGFTPYFESSSLGQEIMDLTWMINVFENLGSGQVHTMHLIYLISMIVFNLLVSVYVLGVRKWGAEIKIRITIFFILLLMVNYVAIRTDRTFDASRDQNYSLSDKSKQVLKNMKDSLEVIVFFQKTNPLNRQLRYLMNQYEDASSLISVTFVDPLKDPAQTKILADKYGISLTEEIVLMKYGLRTKVLPMSALADYDYSGVYSGLPPQLKAFRGEQGITGSILNLLQSGRTLVHFLKGHGEKDLSNREEDGYSELLKHLKSDNIEVKDLSLLGRESLPKDLKTLVIAGPTHALLSEELKLLSDFLDRGGRLLCLVDPIQSTGLASLFQKYGVILGEDVVVDPLRKLPGISPANLFMGSYGPHAITNGMDNIYTLFFLVRSVTATKESPNDLTPLLLTSSEGWGESDYQTSPYEKGIEDLVGPVSVALAAENKATQMRFVVIGDSDFVTNVILHQVGNKDIFLNSLNWILEREALISIPSKESSFAQLQLTERQMMALFWVVVVGIPFLWLMIGLVIFIRRRRS
jgi:ABC-2 type transport system permease protein